ncbi:hypothetical protein WR25_21209 isoform B [Diploscapter pachys]|uniref:CX domain-containing protein n=1 Tax=Diploscapter pachys TaxID=2018661 RepID=A0A2A2KXG2_9BILA|nr:hypothetical protein WR25_21209 isoform B [Diploscapter pachys]
MENKLAQIFVILLLCTLFPPTDSKRGGGVFSGGGRSRGTSGSRMSSGGMSRGTHFGGSSGHKSHNTGGGYYPQGNNAYHRNTNYGHKQPIGSYNPGTNYKQNPGTNWGHGHHNTGFGSGGYHKPHYSKSGVGSFVRSNQFKNMIVGAAAGYLTYQAGKAIIRAAAGPMMWNNRPYYWGQQYYRPSGGASNMCRMPIDSGDQQFGNVHFQVGQNSAHLNYHFASLALSKSSKMLFYLISGPDAPSRDCLGLWMERGVLRLRVLPASFRLRLWLVRFELGLLGRRRPLHRVCFIGHFRRQTLPGLNLNPVLL